MARTYRRIPSRCIRRIKTGALKKQEEGSVDAIKDCGFEPENRDRARGNPNSSKIPSSYDDFSVSAWDEIPDCLQQPDKKGQFIKKRKRKSR